MQLDGEPATAENLHADVMRSLAVAVWIADELTGMSCPELPNDPKLGSALALHHLAVEHAKAIAMLVHEETYGSALALLRPLCDAFLRGHWLQEVAAPKEARKAVDKDRFPDTGILVRHLPDALNDQGMREARKLLNDYVHGGRVQMDGRLGEVGLGSYYKRSQVSSALLLADVFGLSAAWHIGFACPDGKEFTQGCVERLRRMPLSAG